MVDCPYYLRSKRRKLNNGNESFDYFVPQSRAQRRKNSFMHLPTEILMKVFSYLSYTELAKRVRVVNKRFRTLAEHILNTTFKHLEKKLALMQSETAFYTNDMSLDSKEVLSRCKLLNAIEILVLHYELAMTTIWRHVYVPRSKLCMYAGEILDNYTLFIRRYYSTPKFIFIPSRLKDYKVVPKLVQSIKAQTKVFCRHFELVSELPINSISKSGAKLLDILDIDRFSVKTKFDENFTKKTYYCKLNYYFSYCWFAAIEENNTRIEKMSWSEHQKYMYMRFRRLVLAHTEIQLNQLQYLRERERMQNSLYVVPKPRSFIYSGYGEEENRFFFYGVMNQQCYKRRYPSQRENELQESSPLLGSVHAQSKLGVHVMVSLKCPIRLAPRKILQEYLKQNELDFNGRGAFELKLEIISPGNAQIRVPQKFCFIVEGKKK